MSVRDITHHNHIRINSKDKDGVVNVLIRIRLFLRVVVCRRVLALTARVVNTSSVVGAAAIACTDIVVVGVIPSPLTFLTASTMIS